MQVYEIELFGIIQGVGFRPFVYTLAQKTKLKGYVQNRYTSLLIVLECSPSQQKAFLDTLLSSPPPNALIEYHKLREWGDFRAWWKERGLDFEREDSTSTKSFENGFESFEILSSNPAPLSQASMPKTAAQSPLSSSLSLSNLLPPSFLPKDGKICQSCLDEMRQSGRFKNYAFTTCTHCGARYSILKALPYDRIHTSMSEFPMCATCQSEYTTPTNRRFHAQPHSCLECAVRLRLLDEGGELVSYDCATDDIWLIERVAKAIREGAIVAIEGVGGFNLVASANNATAINTLRKRKNRPHKPFAIMFKNIADIELNAYVNEAEIEALKSVAAPIVLLNRRFDTSEGSNKSHTKNNEGFSESSLDSEITAPSAKLSLECLSLIAPNVATIGAILPYNGIMHLLFDFLDTPLIFTSANLSGEPIISDIESLKVKLGGVYDMALFYNRRIIHAIDDSIVRFMGGSMRVLRLARGYAPYQFSLKLPLQTPPNPLLALGVGGQQKLTLSFLLLDSKNSESSLEHTPIQALISPYIGDFGGIEMEKRYKEDFAFFSSLYTQGGDNQNTQEYSTSHISLLGHDLHPRYYSSSFAKGFGKAQAYSISHHKAHFYAILAESGGLVDSGIGIVWDGTGLGEDGSIWGGECFYYEPMSKSMGDFVSEGAKGGECAKKACGKRDYTNKRCIEDTSHKLSYALDSEISESSRDCMRRVAYFEKFALLGGESATKDIYKSAFSLLWQHGLEAEARALCKDSDHSTYAMLYALYRSNFNEGVKKGRDLLLTSSVGRLFDGVAYILGLLKTQSYEGQSGACIEAAALRVAGLDSENMACGLPFGFRIDENGVIKLGEIMRELVHSRDTQGVDMAAYRFIETLAHIAIRLFERYAKCATKGKDRAKRLYLSGGVFQNKLLCDRIHALGKKNGISLIMHKIVPCNDSGISFGQAVYASLKGLEK